MTTSPHPFDSLNEPPRRLLPERAFPPYTYVPGSHWPHPVHDPRGHSYGRPESACAAADPVNWRECQPFLWGIDLFNAGFYWEAHEAWESVWIAAGRVGPTADFVKALIKLAAAGVKLLEQNPAGAQRHLRRAAELLDACGDSSTRFGLSLPALRHALHAARNRAATDFSESPPAPAAVLQLALQPVDA